MLNYMPVGNPTYTDSFDELNNDFFGFIYAEIDATNAKRGLLPYRSITGKLEYPYGDNNNSKWVGWYFSEELKSCMKHGYDINFLYGYKYNKAIIFKEYIEKYYEIKKISTETDNKSLKLLTKLMLNSLYGRFGMTERKTNCVIDTNENINILEKKFKYKELFPITKNTSLINFEDNKVRRREDNISISSSIASYARISLHNFLVRDDVVYTDTDSIVLENPLPNELISDKIGDFKLEYLIKEGYFISPKTYYIDTKDGRTIIKSKGLNKDEKGRYILNKNDYIALYNGISVTKRRHTFYRDFKTFSIIYKYIDVRLSPVIRKLE